MCKGGKRVKVQSFIQQTELFSFGKTKFFSSEINQKHSRTSKICFTWSGVPLAYLQVSRQLGISPRSLNPWQKKASIKGEQVYILGLFQMFHLQWSEQKWGLNLKKAKPENVLVQNLLNLTSPFATLFNFCSAAYFFWEND